MIQVGLRKIRLARARLHDCNAHRRQRLSRPHYRRRAAELMSMSHNRMRVP